MEAEGATKGGRLRNTDSSIYTGPLSLSLSLDLKLPAQTLYIRRVDSFPFN
jgi:hypothetical protein